MLDGSGVEAIPGIPAPGSFNIRKERKIWVAKWGTPKKTFKKRKG
jgi:hypothetical protein